MNTSIRFILGILVPVFMLAGATVSPALAKRPAPPPRYVDNGDGTVSDTVTGLMWEKKEDCNDMQNPHCILNEYTWSISYADGRNGTLYTDFLAKLNLDSVDNPNIEKPCFAGHCDWRIPNLDELRTILLPPEQCSQYPTPCTDPVLGIMRAQFYWSSTIHARHPDLAWGIDFETGNFGYSGRIYDTYARAVRGVRR